MKIQLIIITALINMFLLKEVGSAQDTFSRITPETAFDLQGHRGCRGLYPENTIAGLIEAVKLGVRTLEMDVVVSKDGKLIVSHEPWMSGEICLTPQGDSIPSGEDSIKYNLYKMNYEEIRKFDCGLKPHPRFPHQKKMKAEKPLLEDVINRVEQFVLWNKLKSVKYSIELKSTSDGDNYYQPEPEVFVDKVLSLLQEKNILRRVIIQSFDVRVLQMLHQKDPSVKIAFLVENEKGIVWNLQELKFIPTIYSPDQIAVDIDLITYAHLQGIKIIPWTVNDSVEMQRLYKMGIDGLITDYPDRAFLVFPFLKNKSN